MGYYSYFGGQLEVAGANDVGKLGDIAIKAFGPDVVHIAGVDDINSYEFGVRIESEDAIEVSADGWKWYDFDTNFITFVDECAKEGISVFGEVEVHGEDAYDIWKMVALGDHAVRKNAKLVWEEV